MAPAPTAPRRSRSTYGQIAIASSATNPVGQAHTFTITATATGPQAPTDIKITPNVTPTPDSISDTCAIPTFSNGGKTATCTITINNNSQGAFTATASADFYYGTKLFTRSTNGVAPNSGPAIKRYVDAHITVTPNDTNFIYDPHTFTISVTQDPDGETPATTANITPTITPAPTSQSTTCTNAVAFVNNVATCTVTINSSSVGSFVASASATVTIGGVQITISTDGKGANSGTVTKVYKSAKADLTKTFAVGAFTSPGQACFTLTRVPAATPPPVTSSTNPQCFTYSSSTTSHKFTWNDLVPGSYTIEETTVPTGYVKMTDVTFTVANNFDAGNLSQSFTASDPLKPGKLQISKTVSGGSDLGGNSFQFTVKPCGSDATCATPGTSIGTFTVDGTHNPVTIDNLNEGYYLVTELPVAGFTPDVNPQIVQVNAGQTATVSFNNKPSVFSQLLPTQTTCQQFTSGSASLENVITYGVKSNKINNVAPGVLFYYTKVVATGTTVQFDMLQTHTVTSAFPSGLPFFGVQSVSVFNGNCTSRTSGVTITQSSTAAGAIVHVTITGATAGATYIANIKIDPSPIVGTSVNKVGAVYPTVPFTYATWIPDKATGSLSSKADGTLQPK